MKCTEEALRTKPWHAGLGEERSFDPDRLRRSEKEAYFFAVPCVTLREETEWVETVEAGWNVLVGADEERIIEAVREFQPIGKRAAIFGNGRASERIAKLLLLYYRRERGER